jgi:hypothetical protein
MEVPPHVPASDGNLVNLEVRLQAPALVMRAARPSVSALRLITPTIQFKMACKGYL